MAAQFIAAVIIDRTMNWTLRPARTSDIPALEELIPLSVRSLQASHYSPEQMEAALGTVFGVDRQLIADGTYFVAERNGEIVGCGGWSKRKSWFGGRPAADTVQAELDPTKDPARIRAFFVHPKCARRGIGRGLLAVCENAILAAGFESVELVATLAGEPLYTAGSYRAVERYDLELSNGLRLPVVRMARRFIS
jgi:N-acetylglutamate synthase-like GNAT family acetyltransferase